MSQHQQNWERIIAELRTAIDQVEGPVAGRDWSEFGETTKEVFTEQVQAILDAELSNRFGEETRVNVKIKNALEAIGEQLMRDSGPTGEVVSNV
jgi:hypothetical protein